METNKTRIHPLLAVAAVSVTLLALAGIGVMTGLIPSTQSVTPPTSAPALATQAAEPTLPAPAANLAGTYPSEAPVPVEPARRASPTGPARVIPEPTFAAAPPPMTAPPPPMSAPVAPPVCYDCGTIQSIRQVVVQGQASGAGAVAGGVLGGVLGHQIGHGRGNDAATVLGAVGGAVAGHEIEKSRSKSVRYEIAVQMDDGRMQVIRWRDQPGWREGDRVRVIDGGLAPIGQQY